MDHATGCPEDYAELFAAYFPMMKDVVAASRIAPEDVEDVTMDILARFIEKDGIAYYDPEKLHDVGESPEVPGARIRKAKFSSMLRGFTATYVQQYRDKQMVRHRRIPWRLDKPVVAVGTAYEKNWAEINLGSVDGGLFDVEVSTALVAALRAARDVLRPRSTSVKDYDLFTALCVEHGLLDGKINRKAIATEMGVSLSTVTTMLAELRRTLRPLLVA